MYDKNKKTVSSLVEEVSEMNENRKKLLRLILEQESYQPASYFAKKMNVSSKTIYKNLASLEGWFEEYQMELKKLPRKGIYLEGTQQDKIRMKIAIGDYQNVDFYGTSPAYRRLYIFAKLLFSTESRSYQYYADHFYVSVQSIKNDVDEIVGYCQRQQLTIRRNSSGLFLEGNELLIQQVFKEYVEKYTTRNSLDRRQEEEIFGLTSVETVSNFLEQLIRGDSQIPNEYLLISLRISMLTLVSRLQIDQHMLPEKGLLLERLEKFQLYMTAIELVDSNNHLLGGKFLQTDIYYLCSLLLAHGIKPKIQDENVNSFVKEAVDNMVEIMSEMLGFDLTADEHLKHSLLSHIDPMIYRLRIGIEVRNPLKNQIIQQYSTMYTLTSYCISIIEKNFSLQLTDDEITFLTIHFQVALEKNRAVKHVLIVCPTGLGTSQLVFQKIKQSLPASIVLEIIDLNQMTSVDLSVIDLIIATIQMPDLGIPTVYVSALPTADEITLINKELAVLESENKKFMNHSELNFNDVFDEKFIFLDLVVTSQNEIIDFLADHYQNQNLVKENFRQAIYQRESLGTTGLSSGVAIPHVDPDSVIQTKIAIATLEQPVRWGPNEVSVVILLAIAKKDIAYAKTLIASVYEILSSRESIQQLREYKTKVEIMEKFLMIGEK